jgi:hypothetical protein
VITRPVVPRTLFVGIATALAVEAVCLAVLWLALTVGLGLAG